MKKIKLTKGHHALVDDQDYAWLNQWKWRSENGYAFTCLCRNHKIPMQRVIIQAPNSKIIDHVNGNRSDNRRVNLRICSLADNNRNKGMSKNNSSGYKGVYWQTGAKKWRAQIMKDRKLIYLGLFDSKHEAAISYNINANKLFGQFARINKIQVS